MEINQWIDQLAGGSTKEVADRINMPKRTLQHQIANGMKMETVVSIATAYDKNPLVALVELGYVEDKWLTELATNPVAGLRASTPEQIFDEVMRLMTLGKGVELFDTDINEVAALRSVPDHTFNPELDVATGDDQDAARYGDDDDLHIP